MRHGSQTTGKVTFSGLDKALSLLHCAALHSHKFVRVHCISWRRRNIIASDDSVCSCIVHASSSTLLLLVQGIVSLAAGMNQHSPQIAYSPQFTAILALTSPSLSAETLRAVYGILCTTYALCAYASKVAKNASGYKATSLPVVNGACLPDCIAI